MTGAPDEPKRESDAWVRTVGGLGLLVFVLNLAAATLLIIFVILPLIGFVLEAAILWRAGLGERVPLQLAFAGAGLLLFASAAFIAVSWSRRTPNSTWPVRHPWLTVTGCLLLYDATLQPSASPGPSPVAGAVSLAIGALLWVIAARWLAVLPLAAWKVGWSAIGRSPVASALFVAVGATALVANLAGLAVVGALTATQRRDAMSGLSARLEKPAAGRLGAFGFSPSGGSGDGGDDFGTCLIRIQDSPDCDSHRGQARGILAWRRLQYGDVDDADILQDAALAVCVLRPPPSDPCTMYVTAVKRRAIDRDRRRRAREDCLLRQPLACPLPTPDEQLNQRRSDAYVRDKICELDSQDQEVLLLKLEELSLSEIATRLGIPYDTARLRLKRAGQRLEGRIQEECPPVGN